MLIIFFVLFIEVVEYDFILLFFESQTFQRMVKNSSCPFIEVQYTNTLEWWILCVVLRLSMRLKWGFITLFQNWSMQNPVQFVRFSNKTQYIQCKYEKSPRKNPSVRFSNRCNYHVQNGLAKVSLYSLLRKKNIIIHLVLLIKTAREDLYS